MAADASIPSRAGSLGAPVERGQPTEQTTVDNPTHAVLRITIWYDVRRPDGFWETRNEPLPPVAVRYPRGAKLGQVTVEVEIDGLTVARS